MTPASAAQRTVPPAAGDVVGSLDRLMSLSARAGFEWREHLKEWEFPHKLFETKRRNETFHAVRRSVFVVPVAGMLAGWRCHGEVAGKLTFRLHQKAPKVSYRAQLDFRHPDRVEEPREPLDVTDANHSSSAADPDFPWDDLQGPSEALEAILTGGRVSGYAVRRYKEPMSKNRPAEWIGEELDRLTSVWAIVDARDARLREAEEELRAAMPWLHPAEHKDRAVARVTFEDAQNRARGLNRPLR